MLPEKGLDTGKKFRRLHLVIIFVKKLLNPTSNKDVLCRTRILLQCHAVTLTFKVAIQTLRATRHLNMVILFLK